MNIQWGLDSATVERNSSMCGEHHMICNGEKKCASHYARLSFFFWGGGGERILENMPFATGSCRKFKSKVLVKWKAPKTYKLEDLSRELFLHCDSVITAVIVPNTVLFCFFLFFVFFCQVWKGSSLLAQFVRALHRY